MSIKFAIIGANNRFGRELSNILSEKNVDVDNVFAVDDSKHYGKKINYGVKEGGIDIVSIDDFNFKGVDICFFVSTHLNKDEYINTAVSSGSFVIRNQEIKTFQDFIGIFIVPEYNPYCIKNHLNNKIFFNPNSAVIQVVSFLGPISDVFGVEKIVLNSYHSVSDVSKDAMDELYKQTKSKYYVQEMPPKFFKDKISFNYIPTIGSDCHANYNSYELNTSFAIKQILNKDILISSTCFTMPVFVGNGVSLYVELRDKFEADDIISVISDIPGIVFLENSYQTPAGCVKEDGIFASRLRKESENSFSVWLCTDNLRKGCSLNAFQISELLI